MPTEYYYEDMVKGGKMKKGDVLAVAQVAGIMAAKKNWELIPMCHPIALTGVDIAYELDDEAHIIHIRATARCMARQVLKWRLSPPPP